MQDFSQNDIRNSLSFPSVHFLSPEEERGIGEKILPNPGAAKLVQIRPITDTYLAPPESENNKEESVKPLAFTVNDDYYPNNDYLYYDTISIYEDADEDANIEPKPETTLGEHIVLSELKLGPTQPNKVSLHTEIKVLVYCREKGKKLYNISKI